MKKVGVGIVLFFSVLLAVSCGKKIENGPVSAGLIPLTATPTYTPAINFTAYIHQEGTPAVNVEVQMLNATIGLTATAKTGADGKAGFELHEYGSWVLNVGSFNGFKAQSFPVDPFSNTLHAVNYGIPSLELQLVSGSESIGIAPRTLVYKAIYHTKFERQMEIEFTPSQDISINNLTSIFVFNEGDYVAYEAYVPKSFDQYERDHTYLEIFARGTDNLGQIINSKVRLLRKNWSFSAEATMHYAQVYDYKDNNRKVSYYAGIKNFTANLSCPDYAVTGIKCEAIDAANIGVDGSKAPIAIGLLMPGFTGYGSYTALIKIPSDGNYNNGNMNDDNNGWVTIRFYDNLYFDIKRTFHTNGTWGQKCWHWSCTSSSEIARDNNFCADSINFNLLQYNCPLPWDDAKLADAYRRRVGTVKIYR